MEIYILDSLLRRVEVVDVYESFIWTERFADIGDFELNIMSTQQSRRQFATGTKLAINNSHRVMVVKTSEDSVDSDGKTMLNVKGSSLEAVLDDRIAKDTMDDLSTDPKWVLDDTPANIARTMFNDICVTGNLDSGDIIPFITPGSIFPEDTIPETTTPIIWEQDPGQLYTDAIKRLADLYDLGIRLVRNFDTSQLYFNIYTGNDRTTRQTDLTPVIFSVDMDSLQNTKEFTTIQDSKNVAYVFSDVGSQIVYGEGVDPDIEGFERRVLLVNASNVTAETVDIPGGLTQAGQEALANARALFIFDGELSQYSPYKYGVDYELGDLVELRNIDGVVSYKRVTEQIFVCDQEGERSYPTLSMNLFADANVWLFQTSIQWVDFTTEFWEDM